MGTRSRIGIKLTNGNILSAYHHYDGYPQWLGRHLVEHFNTYDEASELIDGGDMSVCYTTQTWGSKALYQHFLQPDGTTRSELLKNEDGSIKYDIVKETPSPMYYSERGETGVEPRLDDNLFDYLDNGEEYAYVFESGSWTAYDLHEFDDQEPEVVSIPE